MSKLAISIIKKGVKLYCHFFVISETALGTCTSFRKCIGWILRHPIPRFPYPVEFLIINCSSYDQAQYASIGVLRLKIVGVYLEYEAESRLTRRK
jgi:hypothetical protein